MIENGRCHYALTDIPEPFNKPIQSVTQEGDNDFMFLLLLMIFFLDDESFSIDENFMEQLMKIFNLVPENN